MRIFRKRRGTGQRGIMLLECLVYIGVLAVVLELAFAAFYQCTGNSIGLNRNAADIVRAVQAGERWRDDIRNATGPIEWQEENGAPGLTIPQVGGKVLYAFRQGIVWRQAGGADKTEEFLVGVKASQMQREPRSLVVVWRWEVELATAQKTVRVQPLFSFIAAASMEKQP